MASATGLPNTGKMMMFELLTHFDPSIAGPRLGRLSIHERRSFDTPNFFAITSRGVIPHVTPDIISGHTNLGGLHLALEDFIEKASIGTPPIMTCPGPSPLHTFAAIPKSLPSLLAPRRSPAVAAPNGNTNTAISIYTLTGFQVLSNKAYISYIEKLRPDIAIALADVPYGTVPGTKRVAKMADRTQVWLSQILKTKREEQIVFAPVLPIDFLDQSEYLNDITDELADDVSGLAFYDSNLLPDIPATTALTKLPRLSLDEPSSPLQIIRQVSLGMDVFTVPFVGFATDAGIALTFRFPGPLPTETSIWNGTGIIPLGIDMWPATHATSTIPLSTSCSCYTCTSHHRAYIQHLLAAKEMLGWVLLQIHNHYILSEFFTAIRESIKNATFEADCEEFSKVYESELPEKSGQGPRVRGYHYKSEGPGEPKKNKPSWGSLGGDVPTPIDGNLVPDEPAEALQEKGFAEKLEK